MTLVALLPQILLVLGVGFLIANLRVGLELARWARRRRTALITWPAPKPPFFGLSLGIGVMLGLLILLKAYLQLRQASTLGQWLEGFARNAFGELMMFVYFGYMLPLSTRITRGLYAAGIWTDTAFMPYHQIGGISWREELPHATVPLAAPIGEHSTLVVISRLKTVARRLVVPGPALGEVRRHLRDKISAHDIPIDDGPGLHLGARDARDSV